MIKEKAKASDKIDVHRLSDIKLRAFWVLDKLSTEGNDRFSSFEIANHLIEKAGLPTSRQAVESALQKNTKECHKNKSGYKLMHDGQEALRKEMAQEGVRFIDANKPFTAKSSTLKEFLDNTYKEVSICDPYIDVNTLDVLFRNFEKGVSIKILTANIIDKPIGTFSRLLKDLVNEGYKIEVKVYPHSELHDRYIMTDKEFLLSGNSLNYLGKKESFLVLLGEDIRQSMLTTFNSRWKSSKVI